MSGDKLNIKPYVTFIDGSLHYNCAKCKDNCCKGLGFGGREKGSMGSLLENNPYLLPWVQKRNKGFISLSTPKSGCWYLRNDGRCMVELNYGRSAKPDVCLAFPFNRLYTIGDHLVIKPNYLCSHLEPVIPPRPGDVTGSHTAVVEELYATGMVSRKLQTIEDYYGEDVDLLLAGESDFRDACGEALGSRTVTNLLADFSQNSNDFFDFKNRALKLLGYNSSEITLNNNHYDDKLLVMLPTFHFDLISLPNEGRLRALLLAEHLIHFGFFGLVDPKITDLHYFFDLINPLLRVLAFGDEPFEPFKDWNPDKNRPFLDETDHKVAFATMIILTKKGYGTIEALEESLAAVQKPLERFLFMRRLADLCNEPNDKPEIYQDRKNNQGNMLK